MIDKTFRCNICREPFNEKEIRENLFGLRWTTNRKFVRENAYRVEDHICRNCLTIFRSEEFK